MTDRAVLLFVGALAVFLANGRVIGAGDTLPARYLPFSVLRQHDLDLDEFPWLHGEEARGTFPILDGVPYFLRYHGGHFVSAYSPGPAILALPIYALPVLAGVPVEPWAGRLEKLSAAVIAALSVVFLFLALRELTSPGWAWAIAAIYALGTSTWSVSSQALWQHGPSQLFLCVALVCLVRGMRDERFLARSGFALSAAAVMRSTDVFIALPVAAYLLWTRPRLALRMALWAAPPMAGLLAYNLAHLGSVVGGAGSTSAPVWAFFVQVPLAEGLTGTLLSPSRGLFVYSPVLLFALGGLAWVGLRGPALLKALAAGVVASVLVVARWYLWWGGDSWGPRLLADATPLLAFFVYPVTGWLDRHRSMKAVFVVLAAVSIGAHALGAVFYDRRWEGIVDVAHRDAALWSWRQGPLVFYGRQAAAVVRRALGPARSGRPTSADSPALLAASYRVTAIPPRTVVGEPLRLDVIAVNTGGAVWRADAAGSGATDAGVVRLGWRWRRDNVDVAGGRAFLWSDVPPGGSAEFSATIGSPPVPGDYTLTIDLVSEAVTWFADQGAAPVRAAVDVLPLDPGRFLSEPVAATGSSPATAISTDRPSYRRGDVLRLTIELSDPGRPRPFDGYLVRQGPDGQAWFYDGREPPRPARAPWPAWGRALPLPARATGRFALPLSDVGPGRHRWHIVLTEPGTYRAVSRAVTTFTVDE